MVEWKKIGEVCKYYRGRSLSKNDIGLGEANVILYGELYTTYGNYITSVKSKTSIEKAKAATSIQRNDLLLPVSSTTKEAQIGKASVYLGNDDVSLGSDAIILRDAPNSAYLMYYLNSSLFEKDKMGCVHGTTIMHLSPKELVDKKIPVPSFSEQQRIVEQLDTFTCSIENLKEQIAQRRKQYEYYRDQLLDLEGKEGVERLALKEVCEVINGRAYSQPELLSDGKYRVLRVGNFFSNDSWYYSDLELENKYYCEKGDLLYAWSASFGPHIWEEEKVIYHYHIWKMDCSYRLNKKYMYYWLQSDDMKKQAFTNIHGATMAHLTKALMEALQVPVPSLQEQQRIVSILDTFEASIQNLEAQLKQREKQYEYYRNKLLTFE